MPGPSNNKCNKQSKKQKTSIKNLSKPQQTQRDCARSDEPRKLGQMPSSKGSSCTPPSSSDPTHDDSPTSSLDEYSIPLPHLTSFKEHLPRKIEEVLFREPFIHDPGNGPRVRGARAFMASSFSQPPALDNPLCAEFAQDEVLQMLCTVLPEETALILWYNKSRSESRVCPACQRLYRLGDVLQDLLDEPSTKARDKSTPPHLIREQRISGLCSPVCFIMASFNFPSAIKSAWGRMADEMDETTWSLLNEADIGFSQNDVSHTLGMLVKMSRLHDLGLAQLCFGIEDASTLESAKLEDQFKPMLAY